MAVSYILPRLVGLPMANELLFTGRLVTGEKASAIGLANYAVKKDEVLQKAVELADEISMSAPVAVKMLKQSIYRGLAWNPAMAAEVESLCQGKTFEMEDSKEGVYAFLEKRKPVFTGK
jgi:enoyl-CoA hydratase/carnithine racemase